MVLVTDCDALVSAPCVWAWPLPVSHLWLQGEHFLGILGVASPLVHNEVSYFMIWVDLSSYQPSRIVAIPASAIMLEY